MTRKPKNKTPKDYKYYNQKDFDYELSLSREFSDEDAIAIIMLYRVNIVESKVHSLYGEAKNKEKKFLRPIELNITLNMGDTQTNFMNDGTLFNEEYSDISFGVYLQELEEKNCEINRGDLFKYFDGEKERWFEVETSENIKSNNSLLGFKPMYKKVTAVHVKEDVVIDQD